MMVLSRALILRPVALGRCCSQHVRVRFAPSPTGQLHLGGLRSALYNYLFARKHGGKFILRIEDTDQKRLVPGAMDNLIRMLQWCGINIDEGPHVEGNHGPYLQSQRLHHYKEHVDQLLKNGSAYYCFCTQRRLDLLRKSCLSRRETPRYDNRCRNLSEEDISEKLANNTEYVVRFKLRPYDTPWQDLVYGPIVTNVASIEGDPVILKSDKFPTYHLANVVDDHLMDISHVLRGVEWQVSTTKHILMYEAFGWQPPQFAHLPLLVNKDGKKLSKRQNDINVEYLKNSKYFPETVLNFLTSQGSGFKVRDTAGFHMEQLIEQFDLSLLNTNSTRLDFDRIENLNRLHLRHRLNDSRAREELVSQLREIVREKFADSLTGTTEGDELLQSSHLLAVLTWALDRISKIENLIEDEFCFLWALPSSDNILQCESQLQTEVIHGLLSEIQQMKDEDYNEANLKQLLADHSKANHVKFSRLMKTLRVYLSGQKQGPSVVEICIVMGKNIITQRLQFALSLLEQKEEKETVS